MVKTMGRRIPIGYHHEEENIDLTHSVLSLSLQIAWIAATIVMITALCIRRKSSSPPNPSSSPSVKVAGAAVKKSEDMTIQETTMTTPPSTQAARMTTMTDVESLEKTENDLSKELPLPPAMKTLRGTYSCKNLTRAMSMRRVDPSLSMKMPRSMSVSYQDTKNYKKKGKLKTEDSIWRKTIILGEKCRPDDEDDAIIYDNKGKKIPAYHKKKQNTYSFSRTNSRIDQTNAIPGQDEDKGIVTEDEKVLVQLNG